MGEASTTGVVGVAAVGDGETEGLGDGVADAEAGSGVSEALEVTAAAVAVDAEPLGRER